MGTPETTFGIIATNREARNAVFAAIAMISISFLTFSSLIAPALAGQSIPVNTIIEVAVIVGQMLTVIFSLTEIVQGKTELGAWRLIYSFMVTNLVRVLLRESIGLPTAILTAIVTSATAYLTFAPKKAGLANVIGYGVGCVIVLLDLYASDFFSRQATTPDLVTATRNLAIFVFLVQLVILITQARTLSLTTKLSSYFSLFTMIVVAIIGFSSIQIIYNWIVSGNNVPGFAVATLGTLVRSTTAAGAVVSFVGAVIGVFIARTLTNPLGRLTETSVKIASGNLEARPQIDTEDEIGVLAAAFNEMTDALKGMVSQLETRVEERTTDLERRAVQIQAAVDVGRAATTFRDLENLLSHATQLISERFGYYHVGIFLVDQLGEFAVLHAANSEGGKKMLLHGHKLKVGQTGIVGHVTQTGTARIALDVGQDAVFFDNPYLPETRSEMALPLSVSGQILGALDVQSTEPQAFSEEDVATLRIVADQVAIAIQNARLITETQDALEATRLAYGELSRKAWAKIIRSQPRVSFVAASLGTVQASTSTPGADMVKAVETGDVITSSDGLTIGVPIKIRGRPIGVLRLKKADTANVWTHEETTLAISLSEQLSGALESARLYKESQQRAAREALVSDISAHLGAFPRVETIIHETVQELGQAISNAKITFNLVDPSETMDQADGSHGNGREAKQP